MGRGTGGQYSLRRKVFATEVDFRNKPSVVEMSIPKASEIEIPRTPLEVNHVSTGFLPMVGLHRRGGKVWHESSYSMLVVAGGLLAGAVVMALLPLEERGTGNIKIVHYLAAGMVWGALCSAGAYWLRNRFGKRVVFDPAEESVTLIKRGESERFPWREVVCLQICFLDKGTHDEMSGYQLNLVRKGSGSVVERECLYSASTRGGIEDLAGQYKECLPFEVVDHVAGQEKG